MAVWRINGLKVEHTKWQIEADYQSINLQMRSIMNSIKISFRNDDEIIENAAQIC